MDPEAAIRILKEAGNDPAKQTLACVDLVHFDASEAQRAQLRTALEAAAVPHWVDPPILGAMLKLSDLEAKDLLQKLADLSVVEPFEGRGCSAHNVHEKSRLAIRQALNEDAPERFRLWSAHVADFLLRGDAPHERIEWIYHRLIAAPDEAVIELNGLFHEWVESARPEVKQALAFALDELETAGTVVGDAPLARLLEENKNEIVLQLVLKADEQKLLNSPNQVDELEADCFLLLDNLGVSLRLGIPPHFSKANFRDFSLLTKTIVSLHSALSLLGVGRADDQHALAAAAELLVSPR